jgi:septum formation protein
MSAGLILASASPRRRWLLQRAGLRFDTVPADVDESRVSASGPEELARLLAEMKAGEVAARRPDAFVLGADTLVTLDAIVLGKPRDAGDARDMLRTLSGRWHAVATGVCLRREAAGLLRAQTCVTRVRFKELSENDIRWYLATGEPLDKAGGYGIQGKGAFLVREIAGSYTNVVGLPVTETLEMLEAEGALHREEACSRGD